jgi:hypothetical protein
VFSFDVDAISQQYKQQDKTVKPAGLAGLKVILEALEEDPDVTDIRWAAYMLATVRRECADRYQPIEEFGKGKGRPYGVPVTVSDADGTTYTNVYYGRGYVQLTWKANYDNMGKKLGLGNLLVLHPEHALEPKTAYNIMSFGMRHGSFTNKKLADYIHDDVCDYGNARRIINGLDQHTLIAGYAQTFEKLLRSNIKAAAAKAGN